MIYDCFTFYNELEVLDIRLEELYPVVDKFIIVEGSQTFQGKPKSEYGWDHSDRYEKYADKISWCNVNIWPEIKDPNNASWEREYFQRNKIERFLEYDPPRDDDIILISDVDEIPRRSSIALLNPDPVQSIETTMFYYSINVTSNQEWRAIRATRWSYLRDQTTPQELRSQTFDDVLYNSGWHFSYLGSPEHIADKFRSFSHVELNRPDTTDPKVLSDRMSQMTDLWGHGQKYTKLEIDETWPEAIKNNREYWRKYEW